MMTACMHVHYQWKHKVVHLTMYCKKCSVAIHILGRKADACMQFTTCGYSYILYIAI